jgi:hypothetical protein
MSDSDELKQNIVKTANRLRIIQTDFADEDDHARAGYLSEEIERALKKIPPPDHAGFLQGLKERFPAGTFSAQSVSGQARPQTGPAPGDETLKDPDFLVHLLLKVAPGLSEDKKNTIAESLQAAGLAPQAHAGGPSLSAAEISPNLQLTEGAEYNPDRLTELFNLLVDFVDKLDPLVGGTWRQVSPRSGLRLPRNLKHTMKQFICEPDSTSPEKVAEGIKLLQQLIAAIITSIGRVGGEFARKHLSKLSPREIDALVQMERGSMLVSKDVKCWRKYCELAEALTEESVDAEIRKEIAEYVESFMKGMGRLR